MNEEMVIDLKQFITATIAQQTAELRLEIHQLDTRLTGVEEKVAALDKKVTKKIDGLSAAMEHMNDHVGTRLDNHERRIGQLEHAHT